MSIGESASLRASSADAITEVCSVIAAFGCGCNDGYCGNVADSFGAESDAGEGPFQFLRMEFPRSPMARRSRAGAENLGECSGNSITNSARSAGRTAPYRVPAMVAEPSTRVPA
jgi:hypothetical protein